MSAEKVSEIVASLTTISHGTEQDAGHRCVVSGIADSDCIFFINAIIHGVNNKHRKTLESLFANPANGNLPWDQIEALLVALGCQVVEGSGSSVMFEKDGKRAYFHRPHPQRAALNYRIKAAKDFLLKLEIKP